MIRRLPNLLKKMLAVISTLAPYKPNADSLASEIGISRDSVQDYLSLLERAQLIGQLRDDVKTTSSSPKATSFLSGLSG